MRLQRKNVREPDEVRRFPHESLVIIDEGVATKLGRTGATGADADVRRRNAEPSVLD